MWLFCFQNYSDLLGEKISDQEKLLKFKAEDQEFAKFLRSPEQFIHNYSTFIIQVGKIVGIQKPTGKVRKILNLFVEVSQI